MANFKPLKNYMFYCLDHMIREYGMKGPFLDVGSGAGDLSKHVAEKGWTGCSIDVSGKAIESTKHALAGYPCVAVSQKPLFQEQGKYNTVFLWDVLEHIQEDDEALRKIESLLLPGGYLIMALPSNPSEWRWDDEFYGHVRRYSKEMIHAKTINAGFSPVDVYDFTFPVFWVMRRLYTRLKKRPCISDDKQQNTMNSSSMSAWEVRGLSRWLNRDNIIWRVIYVVQFRFFRKMTNRGHEMFVVVQKI
jgi:SAM-dependent methyltransferase